MNCEYCKNYYCKTPTYQDPDQYEYCKIYGDYSDMYDSEFTGCNSFELSEYGKRMLKKEREKKLKRICDE